MTLANDDVAAVRARLGWHDGARTEQRCAVTGFDASASSAAALAYASGWAERNGGVVVVVHVDAAPGATLAESACMMAGAAIPEVPTCDMSADICDAMAYVLADWAYLNTRGDVADQLERVAAALEADVIVVGKSTRRRMRLARSVGRRLLTMTRHIIVIV